MLQTKLFARVAILPVLLGLLFLNGCAKRQETTAASADPAAAKAKQDTILVQALLLASAEWKAAFNRGDAAGCAAQYEPNAIMTAKPFGTFKGRQAIEAFWQQLIDDGFNSVEYIDPKIELVNKDSAILTSGWRMNKAKGIITKELWVMQADGTLKLRVDNFEVQN